MKMKLKLDSASREAYSPGFEGGRYFHEVFIAILLVLIFLLGPSHALAEILAGKVVGVTDGDTITILDESKRQHKIRLGGIDAPEKKQPFGQRSKERLSDLVFSKQVLIDWKKKDRYGRIVGKIIAEGRDANLEMVVSGMAWHYKDYQKEQSFSDRFAYAEAEKKARAARLGLWRDPEPMPPWEFRKIKKGLKSSKFESL